MDAATGNERRPTIARRYAGTCSRCDEDERIDDDDQADQQHERVYSHTFVLFRLLYSSLFAAMVAQH